MINEDDLKKILDDIENGEKITTDISKNFFDRFNIPNLLYAGNWFGTLELGDKVLHLVNRLNHKVYTDIHKGAVFYWMGMAAFLLRNYQLAIYYMDAAVSEDIKNDPNPDTPARLFIRLEGGNPYQAGKNLTQDAETIIFCYVSMYNNLVCKSNSSFNAISMKRIRTKLLERAATTTDPQFRSLATMLISFFLEFDFLSTQLMLREGPGTNEPFFLHLFKGGLLFESLIKNNPNFKVTANTLNKILIELDKELGFPGELDFRGSKDFKELLVQLESNSDSMRDAIKDVSTIRNVVGHNIAWNTNMESEKYVKAFFSIALSCIHVISRLYD